MYCDDPADIKFNETYPKRHARCYSTLAKLKQNWLRNGSEVISMERHTISPESQLPVQLLRTCRQIRKEASHLPYSTNTFAFHEGYTLDLFIYKGLRTPQKRQIRTIQADGCLTGPEEPYAVKRRTVRMLKGLQSIQVWAMFGQRQRAWGVECFKQLKLSDVKVIIGVVWAGDDPGSAKQRRESAEEVERRLKRNVVV